MVSAELLLRSTEKERSGVEKFLFVHRPDKILFSESKCTVFEGPTFQITLESWLGFGKQTLWYKYVRRGILHAGKVLESTFPEIKIQIQICKSDPYLQVHYGPLRSQQNISPVQLVASITYSLSLSDSFFLLLRRAC